MASLFTAACILAVGDAASKTGAASSRQISQRTHKYFPSPAKPMIFAQTGFTNTLPVACAMYSSAVDSQSRLISGSSGKKWPLCSSADATTTVKSGYLAPKGSLTTTPVTRSMILSVNGGSRAKNTSSASASMATTTTMASASSTSIGSVDTK
ncbi:hypothetical protein ABEW05_006483 [Botrytis cinerea]